MMNIEKLKQDKLLQIKEARINLNSEILRGFITTKDILSLLKVSPYYGLKIQNRIYSYKKSVLISIFNSPFLLCDQENLDVSVKKILPIFLNARFEMELDQLTYYYKEGFLSKKQLKEEIELLKYYYYESSIEGQTILNNNELNVKVKKI